MNIESFNHTGIVKFDGLSINTDNTKFNVGRVDSLFVDSDSDQTNPRKRRRIIEPQTGISAIYLATKKATWIGIEEDGTVIQSVDDFTREQLKTICRLGRISHFNNASIDNTYDMPLVVETDINRAAYIMSRGTIKISGLDIIVNSTDLSLKRLEGISERIGCGVSRSVIDFPYSPESAGFTFFPVYLDALGDGQIMTPTTQIDPTRYNPSYGVLSAVDSGNFVNLYVVFLPYKNNQTIFVMYGHNQFISIQDALFAADDKFDGVGDFFVPTTVGGGCLLASISMRQDQTNLQAAIDSGNAIITLTDSDGFLKKTSLEIKPADTVYNDLPTTIDGVHKLKAGASYYFGNKIITSEYPIELNPLGGSNIYDLTFIYTGSGKAILGNFENQTVNTIEYTTIIAPHPDAKIFDISGTGLGKFSVLFLDKFAILSPDGGITHSCKGYGNIEDITIIGRALQFLDGEDGLDIRNLYKFDLFTVNVNLFSGSSGNFFNFGGSNFIEVASKLGAETVIYSLAVLDGKIYGGTSPGGKLYEWSGINSWVEVAPQLGAETVIYSLAVLDGKLYGGTLPGGKLYRWNGSTSWIEVAPQLGVETGINSLAVFNGKLYGGTSPNGKLYEFNGTNSWVEVAPQLGTETIIRSLAVFNGKLYGGTAPGGKLYEWNGTNLWVEVAPKLGAETQILSLAVLDGNIYGGTLPGGKLYRWNGSNSWVEVAPKLGAETAIYSLAVLDGKIYGGTFPNGKLYRWNGSTAWVEVAPKLGAEGYILSLAVLNGKIYGGTALNGKLYEYFGDIYNGIVQISGFSPELKLNTQYAFNFNKSVNYEGFTMNGSVPSISGTATEDNLFNPAGYNSTTPEFKASGNFDTIEESTVYSEIKVIGNTNENVYPATNTWIQISIDKTKITEVNQERITNDGMVETFIGKGKTKISLDGNFKFTTTGVNKDYYVQFAYIEPESRIVTLTDIGDLINETATPRVNGDGIRLSTTGTLPTELSTQVLYYVVNKNPLIQNSFQISNAKGGTAITFTGVGTGIISYNKSELIDADDNAIVSSGTPVKLKPTGLKKITYNYKIVVMTKTVTSPIVNSVITELYMKKFKI